jgi:hypothetical protein
MTLQFGTEGVDLSFMHVLHCMQGMLELLN